MKRHSYQGKEKSFSSGPEESDLLFIKDVDDGGADVILSQATKEEPELIISDVHEVIFQSNHDEFRTLSPKMEHTTRTLPKMKRSVVVCLHN